MLLEMTWKVFCRGCFVDCVIAATQLAAEKIAREKYGDSAIVWSCFS